MLGDPAVERTEPVLGRLERDGLMVDGWIVLTHDDDLGPADRELLVRNAYGEPYSYALCPRADDVREVFRGPADQDWGTDRDGVDQAVEDPFAR